MRVDDVFAELTKVVGEIAHAQTRGAASRRSLISWAERLATVVAGLLRLAGKGYNDPS